MYRPHVEGYRWVISGQFVSTLFTLARVSLWLARSAYLWQTFTGNSITGRLEFPYDYPVKAKVGMMSKKPFGLFGIFVVTTCILTVIVASGLLYLSAFLRADMLMDDKFFSDPSTLEGTRNEEGPTDTSERDNNVTTPSVSPPPLNTLESPLADVTLPSEPIPFPQGWPEEWYLPDEFVLLDATAGITPESGKLTRSGAFKFDGTSTDAVAQLEMFLEEKEWQRDETHLLDTGGMLILFSKRTRNATGIALIEPSYGEGGTVTNVIISVFGDISED